MVSGYPLEHPFEQTDVLFRFRFKKPDMHDGHFTVYSDRRDFMDMFLRQHGFSLEHAYVDVLSVHDVQPSSLNTSLLQPYKFKSNNSDEVFTIITAEWLISSAVDETCSDLSGTLMLGPASIRGDIEIFNIINQLIDMLPYVYVRDEKLIDGDSGNMFEEEEENRYCDRPTALDLYDQYSLTGDDMDVYLYESMHSARTGEIQPITVERYVHSFTGFVV